MNWGMPMLELGWLGQLSSAIQDALDSDGTQLLPRIASGIGL